MSRESFHQSLDWHTRFAVGGEFSREDIEGMLDLIKEYEEAADKESKYEVAIDDALGELKVFRDWHEDEQEDKINEIICILTDI